MHTPYTETDCKLETREHIMEVQTRLLSMSAELVARATAHDASKLSGIELEYFTKFTPKLREAEYLSDTYKQNLADMKPAIDHHYAVNDHHPEHYPDGINGMNLLSLVEMLCDWSAAVHRSPNGDIRKSIELNAERFNIDPQLTRILLNTVDAVEGL